MRIEDVRALARDICLGSRARFTGSLATEVKLMPQLLEEPGSGIILDGNKPVWNAKSWELMKELRTSLEVKADCSSEIWKWLDLKRKAWFVKPRSKESFADEEATRAMTEFEGKPLNNGMTVGHFMAVHEGFWYDARPILMKLATEASLVASEGILPTLEVDESKEGSEALMEIAKAYLKAHLSHRSPFTVAGKVRLEGKLQLNHAKAYANGMADKEAAKKLLNGGLKKGFKQMLDELNQ